MVTKKVSALIPIKQHSERVPGKNFKTFASKPLYFWITHLLLRCPYVDFVHIDTDSKIIMNEFRNMPRVNVIERSKDLRGDDVSVNKIIKYDLSHIKNEHVLQTHITNPLLTQETVAFAIKSYFENIPKYDSLFSVTEYKKRFFDHKLKPINHELGKLIKTQDLNPVYEENSNMYIFSKSSFNLSNNRIGKKPLLFKMKVYEAFDIDEKNDFLISEAIMRMKIIK